MNWDLIRDQLPAHVRNPDTSVYMSGNYVVLDFETTNFKKGQPHYDENSLVLACWRCGPGHPDYTGRVCAAWGDEFNQMPLLHAIHKAEFIIAHNAKFELGWLERCGVDTANTVVWDTLLADYVRGGNRWLHAKLSLESCAERAFGGKKGDIVSRMMRKGDMCSTEIPRQWLLDYCAQDVRLTERLFNYQREDVVARGQTHLVYLRCLLPAVLYDIERAGMRLDASVVIPLYEAKEREFTELSEKMTALTGNVNMNSPMQLKAYLVDVLQFPPDAVPNTQAATLAKLKGRTPEQKAFLEIYSKHSSLSDELTKYLRKFNACCVEAGGLMTGVFNQGSTQTHRLSSSGREYSTQFQNFARAYKPLFHAGEPGWLIGEADGAQLEFRVAGHLGRDAAIIGSVARGEDVHAETAAIMGVSRTAAKAHTFKPLYGGRKGNERETRYYTHFRQKYEGITKAQEAWVDEVLATKKLRTEYGMEFFWPDTELQRSGYVTNTTNICNYPVQGFATAEMIPISLVYMWHYLRQAESPMRIINTVHDSIVVALPEEDVDAFRTLAKKCLIDEVYFFLKRVYSIDLVVPLGAGVCVSTHWGDEAAKKSEIKYNAEEALWVK